MDIILLDTPFTLKQYFIHYKSEQDWAAGASLFKPQNTDDILTCTCCTDPIVSSWFYSIKYIRTQRFICSALNKKVACQHLIYFIPETKFFEERFNELEHKALLSTVCQVYHTGWRALPNVKCLGQELGKK